MTAQRKNEWISLSVLSVARVMTAQRQNECISLSALSVAKVMIAQWENEWISLAVRPVARVHFPAMGEYFNGLHVLPCIQSGKTKRPGQPLKPWLRAEWRPLVSLAGKEMRDLRIYPQTCSSRWVCQRHRPMMRNEPPAAFPIRQERSDSSSQNQLHTAKRGNRMYSRSVYSVQGFISSYSSIWSSYLTNIDAY